MGEGALPQVSTVEFAPFSPPPLAEEGRDCRARFVAIEAFVLPPSGGVWDNGNQSNANTNR